MALILETGAGLSTANSYVSVAQADAYHSLYGNADWAGETVDKEAALIHATKAIDLLYGQEYLSMPLTSAQALLFPRFFVVVNRIQIIQSGTLPKQLTDAVCEVALLRLNGTEVYARPNTDSTVRTESVSAGGVAIATTYSGHVPGERYADFWKVELLLKPLLRGNGSQNPSRYGI